MRYYVSENLKRWSKFKMVCLKPQKLIKFEILLYIGGFYNFYENSFAYEG